MNALAAFRDSQEQTWSRSQIQNEPQHGSLSHLICQMRSGDETRIGCETSFLYFIFCSKYDRLCHAYNCPLLGLCDRNTAAIKQDRCVCVCVCVCVGGGGGGGGGVY